MTVTGHQVRSAYLATAQSLLTSVATRIREQGSLHARLDLCIAAMELERATGTAFGARAALGESFELLRAARGLTPWLYGGAAHAGWTANTFCRVTGRAAPPLGHIDDLLVRWAEEYPDDHDVDLPRGLLGLGVYGLAHPVPTVREKITGAVVDRIDERVQRRDATAWITLADTPHRRANAPGEVGHRDLGMAHGNAGLLAFLAAVGAGGGPAGDRARRMIPDLFTWLRGQRALAPGTVFPQSVETRYRATRSAWCYGDPGVSLALRLAAAALADRPIDAAAAAALADEAAGAVLERPADQLGVHDACMCHGVAGLAYFARRTEEHTGSAPWRTAASTWCDELVRSVRAGELQYVFPTGSAPNTSILEGDLGVVLVLLYVGTGHVPVWDELLLTRPPAPASGGQR